ncbi:MAG: dihydropteroate synthase [Solirubrobacteraceae bacterium]
MKLKLGKHTIALQPGAPLVMGIVNIGHDSVADSRSLRTLHAQREFALRQHEDGAHIIDIGVQSGRTDTPVISEEEEIERLVPLVSILGDEGIVVSVDIWRSGVADAAISAGASLINDVSGLADEGMADVCARTGAGLVVMHTRAAPKMVNFPGYKDPMGDVIDLLSERIEQAVSAGVDREQIVVDPGLDYAKTPQESIEVLRRLAELQRFDRPILLAVSRKYFIGILTGKGPEKRLAGTLAAVGFGVSAGAHIVRVHDVGEVCDFLTLRAALRGDGPVELRGDPDDDSLKWLASR